MNYRDAVRQSFSVKLALWLSQATREMDTALSFAEGVVQFNVTSGVNGQPVSYLVKPLEGEEEFVYPGVNIEFFDEVDHSPDRLTNKRYLLPVKITVVQAIEGNVNPGALGVEVRSVMAQILECLSDGRVEIWDFTGDTPVDSGRVGNWAKTGGYSFSDESAAFAGGDIRHTLSLNISFSDFTF